MTKLIVGQVGRSEVYHTDRECVNLNNSPKEPREASASDIEFHDLTECIVCKGDKPDPGEATWPEIFDGGHDPGPLDPDALVAAREEARKIADSFESDPFGDVANAE